MRCFITQQCIQKRKQRGEHGKTLQVHRAYSALPLCDCIPFFQFEIKMQTFQVFFLLLLHIYLRWITEISRRTVSDVVIVGFLTMGSILSFSFFFERC